jgi:transcriptional regulator with XRE-family HTH domain
VRKIVPPFIRIKYERVKRGWSQTDVAQRANKHGAYPKLDQNDISKMEQGRLLSTEEQLDALGRAFNISPASVLFEPVAIADPEPEPVLVTTHDAVRG